MHCTLHRLIDDICPVVRRQMARAGFVHTPQPSDDTPDDTATCFYCDLSLSGWDADDDPL
jgi:hypothetical protein